MDVNATVVEHEAIVKKSHGGGIVSIIMEELHV